MTETHKTELLPPHSKGAQSAGPEDISIVMAVYNHEATVAEALESALMQEMPYTSVIYCLNDASTDKSAEILRDYASRYPDKIKVYTSPKNLGLGKKSILYHQPPVKGKYWCLLAGDDFWISRDKLAKQIAFLDSHPDFTGCSCNTVMRNEMTGEESIIKPDRNSWNLLDLMLLQKRYAFYVHPSSVIWRNIHMDQDSFLPPSFRKEFAHGDVMLMHMMLGKGGKVQNISEVMSCYRVTGRGVWTSKSAKEQAELTDRVMKIICRSLTFKYKIFVYLNRFRCRSNLIKNFVPGPVNE
jgi:glycosyltransferase involved in cell wall biosynthesis